MTFGYRSKDVHVKPTKDDTEIMEEIYIYIYFGVALNNKFSWKSHLRHIHSKNITIQG